jgi:hypothetical protein
MFISPPAAVHFLFDCALDCRALAGKNKNAPIIRKQRMIGKSRHLARDRLDNRRRRKILAGLQVSNQSVESILVPRCIAGFHYAV